MSSIDDPQHTYRLSTVEGVWKGDVPSKPYREWVPRVTLWKFRLAILPGWRLPQPKGLYQPFLWKLVLAHRTIISSLFFPDPNSCVSGYFTVSPWWLPCWLDNSGSFNLRTVTVTRIETINCLIKLHQLFLRLDVDVSFTYSVR